MSSVALPFTSRQLVSPLHGLRFQLPAELGLGALLVDRRLERLREQLAYLRTVWEDLDQRLADYAEAHPWDEVDALTDALDCLQWLRRTRALTPLEQDHWSCQQAVCLLAQRRGAYGRKFSQFAACCRPSIGPWTAVDGQPVGGRSRLAEPGWILVNPLRQWVTLSALAAGHGARRPPANVLLFGAEQEVRAAAFGLEGLALFNSLVDHEPCTLDEWAVEVTLAGQELLRDFCFDLASMGLVAIGRRAPGNPALPAIGSR